MVQNTSLNVIQSKVALEGRMGRKLNSAEADVFAKDSTSLPNQTAEVTSSYGSVLQSRIAKALDLSVADFLHPAESEKHTQEANHDGHAPETGLTRDCVDLIEAFVRVVDPKERERILNMVRNAARLSEHEEPQG
jgi:hypothetical protein